MSVSASTPAEIQSAPTAAAPGAEGVAALVETVAALVEGAASLGEIAAALAADPFKWLPRVRLSPDGRWYERLHQDDDREIWLISWLPGQSTGLHDHGGSRGAFAVALGTLEEQDLGNTRKLSSREVRAFGAEYVHEVRNTSTAPAVSVHVYSPPLSTMNRYELSPDGELVRLVHETAEQW